MKKHQIPKNKKHQMKKHQIPKNKKYQMKKHQIPKCVNWNLVLEICIFLSYFF